MQLANRFCHALYKSDIHAKSVLLLFVVGRWVLTVINKIYLLHIFNVQTFFSVAGDE